MATTGTTRDIIFISKATPGDDEFVLWLAPRLEAAGYAVFADILNLEPGDRWRKQVTGTLQNKAIRMLLCCRDSTLSRDGVQEEIGIAQDVAEELKESRFIIPLRLERFKKLFGIGELQYVDFVGSWASGLRELLDALERQRVPRSRSEIVINPNWEGYKARLALKVEESPETLTMNWLRILETPDVIRYYQPTGAVEQSLLESACRRSQFPAEVHMRGLFSFATPEEIGRQFANVGRFAVHSAHSLVEFLEQGSESRRLHPRDAQNIVSTMFRSSWEIFCRSKGLHEYVYSSQPGFHAAEIHAPLGKRIPWGEKEKRRSAMLRNSAGGKVWQFGVSGLPYFWPFLHFRIKARVLFAELVGGGAGAVFPDAGQQHRLRRTICKGWRNKAWHGRFMALMVLISEGSPTLDLPLSESAPLKVDAIPLKVTVPVTTAVSDAMSEDAEERDDSTLGDLEREEDE